MSGVGGVIILIVIIRLIASAARSGDSGQKSDTSQNTYAVAIVIWPFFIFPFIQFIKKDEIFAICYLIFFIPLLLPSLISYLLTKFGLVKLSFQVASWSFVYFGQNKFAGSLFRGLQAIQNLKTDAAKTEALRWLKSKYLAHKGKIYSGDMVVATIIDAHLHRPGDNIYMAQQLSLLNGIGSASIHRKIALYASKLALAPALASKDWIQMQRIATQWDAMSYNLITKYILAFSDRVFNSNYSSIGVFCLRVLNWRRKDLILLLQEFEAFIKEKEATEYRKIKKSELWQFSVFTKKQARNFSQQLNQDTDKWLERAQELGVWDLEEVKVRLNESVSRVLSIKSHSLVSADNNEYERLEQQHKNLQYVAQSVQGRLHAKSLGHGVQNYLDWLKIKSILHELSVDDGIHSAAFSSIHQIIWNWVADLWNHKRERSLVHFIASNCAPLALDNGHREMHEILQGLTLGRFK